MNKEAKIIIDDICAHSVTFPSIPTTLISRKSYFDLFEEQFETYKVLCLPGAEGVGLTTALAEFAKMHGQYCISYFIGKHPINTHCKAIHSSVTLPIKKP